VAGDVTVVVEVESPVAAKGGDGESVASVDAGTGIVTVVVEDSDIVVTSPLGAAFDAASEVDGAADGTSDEAATDEASGGAVDD
jgi:hypothetical protein